MSINTIPMNVPSHKGTNAIIRQKERNNARKNLSKENLVWKS